MNRLYHLFSRWSFLIPFVASVVYAFFATLWVLVWRGYLIEAKSIQGRFSPEHLESFSQWSFVAVGTILVYIVVRLALGFLLKPACSNSAYDVDAPVLKVTATVFLMLAIAIGATGTKVYFNFSNQLMDAERRELASITNLKREQLSRWLEEHRRNLLSITSNPYLLRELREWAGHIQQTDSPPERALERLNMLLRLQGYREVALMGPSGKPLVVVSQSGARSVVPREVSAMEEKLLTSARLAPEVAVAVSPELDDGLEVDVVAPLLWEPDGSEAKTSLALLAKINPQHQLFPLLASWPVSKRTARILLLDENGAWALAVRPDPHRAETFRLEAVTDSSFASFAIAGKSRGAELIDAVGHKWIASAESVPDAHWVVLGMEDESEVSGPLRRLVLWSSVTTAIALILAALVTYLIWRQQNFAQLVLAQRLQIERQGLLKHFDYLVKFANDGFLLTDGALRVLEVNDRLLSYIGFAREDVTYRPLAGFVALGHLSNFNHEISDLSDSGKLFESLLRCSDGNELPVEISARLFEADGKIFYQYVIRDIRERKRAETEQHAADERFRKVLDHNVSGVIILEDQRFAYANARACQLFGHPADVLASKNFLDLVVGERPEILSQKIEELLLEPEGKGGCEFEVLRADGSVASIGMQCVHLILHGKSALVCSAQDIGESKKARQEIELRIRQLEDSMQSTLAAVANMVELRDPYTAGHERRVGDLAAAIAFEMGIDEHRVTGIRLAGCVHDVGKISVPAELLSKPSRLSAIEFEFIKEHPQHGYDILCGIDFPWPIAEVILQHHERLDGSGYPQQLKGDEIILEARIMAVADVVEAMSSHRPYRAGLGIDKALGEVEAQRGKHYDPQVVDACIRMFREKGYELPQ